MIGLILSYFGYVRVPVEAVRLIMRIKEEADKENPNLILIKEAAGVLEELFRSARRITL